MELFAVRIKKQYCNFSSAHFLVFEDGERESLHGHNYYVSCELTGKLRAQSDMLIDFRSVKPIIKKICDSLDHKVLLANDNRYLKFEEDGKSLSVSCLSDGSLWVFPKNDSILLPISNTSVELISKYICFLTLLELRKEFGDILIFNLEFATEETQGQAGVYKRAFPDGELLKNIIDSNGFDSGSML